MEKLEKMFQFATEIYAEHGVDVKKAIEDADKCSIGIHAWQGDDVRGFENTNHALTGGCQVTGNYMGCARTSEELRQDLDFAFGFIPGKIKVVLQGHEMDNLNPGQDRDSLTIENFANWVDWVMSKKIGLDIAPAFYSHPNLDHGLSLSHPDKKIRKFWINHAKACRRISAEIAKKTKIQSVCNEWAPDGFKDTPADRLSPRLRLRDSLDEIFSEEFPEKLLIDAVEPKLFGIGAESYTVGSSDFYLTYCAQRKKAMCIDSGHFHPTENIADKLSAITALQGKILLHVSRGVRWDSDHVIITNDELVQIGKEITACGTKNIAICLDYFDATINRVGAWAIGAQNMRKALLQGFLEPRAEIIGAEKDWDFTARLARQEEAKTLPWGIVWEYYCETRGIPSTQVMLKQIKQYEKKVLSKR